jgi:triacylglycerol lipase
MTRPSALLITVTMLCLAAPGVAAADPPLTVGGSALSAALQCPSAFTHADRPAVLLVHGTGLTAPESWSWNYANALPQEGFDVCEVTLPDRALGDIQTATQYVVYAIEHIAGETGRRVDVITHSQGGMEGRWAVRWWPTARAEVDHLILLASPNHGIYAADGCARSGNCWPAVWQMAEGSKFLGALNSGSETPAGPSYTNVYSLTDELVEPSSTVPLSGANTSNISVQSICPGRAVHHAGLLEDAVAGALVMDALTHPGPAQATRIAAAVCTQAFMPYVNAQDAVGGNAILYGNAVAAFAAHPGVGAEPALAPYAQG